MDCPTINAASKEVSQIIGNQQTAALYVVHSYDSLPGCSFGKDQSLNEQGAYGITYPGKMINIYVQDPSGKFHPVPGWKMSNGLPAIQTFGTNTGHELGHAWGFMQGIGNEDLNNRQALNLENKVRTLKNPNAPTRQEH